MNRGELLILFAKHRQVRIILLQVRSSGVIFAGNSISIIWIFFTAYIDIIDIISIFSKSSNHLRTLTIYFWNWIDNTVLIKT